MKRQNNFALDEVNEMLAKETLSIFERGRLKEYLSWASEFPKYSGRNQALIHHQMPEATMVAGIKDWNKQGRYVTKGQKGMKIYCANKRKRWVEKKDSSGNPIIGPDGTPEKEAVWETNGNYSVKYVFDVSQTAGKPVPSITTMLRGKVDGFEEVIDAIRAMSPARCFKAIKGAEEIGYLADEDAIVVDANWSEQKIMQVALPSLAAAFMHHEEGKTVTYDSLEAESVAYMIAKQLGIDADYDFDYIADWSDGKELYELTEALVLIRDAAVKITNKFKTVMTAKAL